VPETLNLKRDTHPYAPGIFIECDIMGMEYAVFDLPMITGELWQIRSIELLKLHLNRAVHGLKFG